MSTIVTHTNPADCLQKNVWTMIPNNKIVRVYADPNTGTNLSSVRMLVSEEFWTGDLLSFYIEYSWNAFGESILEICKNAPLPEAPPLP